MKKICGNAGDNVYLTYKGGCRKEIDIKEAYRCLGCGGWFCKECLEKHFELEKDHDWGRKQERIENENALALVIDILYLKYKQNFVDYKNKTHKLGWFKEEIKKGFSDAINLKKIK